MNVSQTKANKEKKVASSRYPKTLNCQPSFLHSSAKWEALFGVHEIFLLQIPSLKRQKEKDEKE